MCGIFGAINHSGKFSENELKSFDGSLQSIAHRGPDNQSNYQKFIAENNTDVFFGHRRLSILDLSESGNQPFIQDDVVLIFNGEIFNYVELKEQFFSGEKFQSDSDTEVIIKIYKKFGVEGFNHFNGMWAFALYDIKNNKVILSRDRFSIKPLYYTLQNDMLYFGSEIRELLPFVTKKPNLERVYQFLRQGVKDHDLNTFFEGIVKVPAKSYVVIDLNSKKYTTEKYWEFSEKNSSLNNPTEEFRTLLEDAVKIRLRSDVEIGSLLSGGIDSSVITLLSNYSQPIKAFSVVSKVKEFSEENFIDKVTATHKFNTVKYNFNEKDIINYIQEVLHHQEEPYGSSSVIAQYLIYKTIKDKASLKVVMSGQGADEILLGYVRFFFFSIGYALKKKEIGYLCNLLFGSVFNGNLFYHFDLKMAKRALLNQQLSNQFDFLLLQEKEVKKWSDKYNLRKTQIDDVDLFSIPALAHYEDRNSMAHSIEVRHPFLDHRLVDFAVNLPLKQKVNKGWTKYILRQAMKELDAEIRWRKDKKGFVTPEEKWFKVELKESIIKEFSNSKLAEMGIIDAGKFKAQYNDFLNGKGLLKSADIFRVYITELWAKKYFS